jgi:probable aminopeptidase NPEPL1
MELAFAPVEEVLAAEAVLFLGRAAQLHEAKALRAPLVTDGTWRRMLAHADTGSDGRLLGTWRDTQPHYVGIGVLPEECARANSPSRAWAVPGLVEAMGRWSDLGVVLLPDDAAHVPALAMAVARAVPSWSPRTLRRPQRVRVACAAGISAAAREAADAVRRATAWTDRPTNDFGVDAFVVAAREVATRTGARWTEIRGEDLRQQGFGGLWGVGRAAREAPALVALDHVPAASVPSMAWVGKGIVYDTGGLSIKAKTAMPGMKMDMAGAAAVLAAFEAVARLALPIRLTAVLCLAENAIGPDATRPDDLIALKSGRIVEVNNTDAEGRLVLADGLAWVAKERGPQRIVDIATLTGAQMAAIGKRVGGVYCPDEEWERAVCAAGRSSGEPFHPLPVFPEFHRKEFRSHVGDLRNSVADRDNAQSSCAAWFLQDSLDAVGFRGPWAHLDVCGPAMLARGRGTGFGTGVLLTLAGAFGG